MIKPTELLKTSDDIQFQHFVFYGNKELPSTIYREKISKDITGELDLSQIKWENFSIEGGSPITHNVYNFSDAIASVTYKCNANFVAKVLDKFCKVFSFITDEEKRTIYIYCEVK